MDRVTTYYTNTKKNFTNINDESELGIRYARARYATSCIFIDKIV